ncbi:MAG: methylated-DNA--[protein]-cysteine S-methyltransferase [Balneolaceae bacterium]
MPEKTLYQNVLSTPIGEMYSVYSDDALHLLEFYNAERINKQIKKLNIQPVQGPAEHPVYKQLIFEIGLYFTGALKEFSIPLNPSGTLFQQRVWECLRDIPYGHTISYEALTNTLGNTNAIRAVAAANGANPIAILIPCHRVIGKNGALTGYAGGLNRKRKLLALEKLNSDEKIYQPGDQMELTPHIR